MVTILEAADKGAWQEILSRFAQVDVYQSGGYHHACEISEGGQAILLVAEHRCDQAAMPLLVQPAPGDEGLCHATSAYGYPGVLATAATPGLSEELRKGLDTLCDALGVVSVSVRLNPFSEVNRVLTSFMSTRTVGPSVFLDLRQSQEQQWGQARTRHRRYYRRTEREHHPVLLSDPGFEHLKEFAELYRSTMRRNQAAPAYFFTDPYFTTLADECAGVMLFHAVVADRIVSSTLMFDSGHVVHGHLGGTRDGWEASGVSRWLLETVRRHYSAEGRVALHLGGGLGGRRDALFEYKQGFGGALTELQVCSLVLQHGPYHELAERYPTADRSRFPAYDLGPLPRGRPAMGARGSVGRGRPESSVPGLHQPVADEVSDPDHVIG